jgi:hypothetical protein
MIYRPPRIAGIGDSSREGDEPEQSLWFSVSFELTQSSLISL